MSVEISYVCTSDWKVPVEHLCLVARRYDRSMTSKKAALWIVVATVLLVALTFVIFITDDSQSLSQTICDIVLRGDC